MIEILIQSRRSAPATLAIILAVAIAVELYPHVPPAFAERWAGERGLELTAENRSLVARYLRRARLFRTWGGVIGCCSRRYRLRGGRPRHGARLRDHGNSAPLGFGAIFSAISPAPCFPELTTVRPARGPRRVASLERRELESYLPRWVLLAQRWSRGAGHRTIAVAAVPFPATTSNPSSGGLVAIAVLIVALAVGLETIERWIVHRPNRSWSRGWWPPTTRSAPSRFAQRPAPGLALLLLRRRYLARPAGVGRLALHRRWSSPPPSASSRHCSRTRESATAPGAWPVRPRCQGDAGDAEVDPARRSRRTSNCASRSPRSCSRTRSRRAIACPRSVSSRTTSGSPAARSRARIASSSPTGSSRPTAATDSDRGSAARARPAVRAARRGALVRRAASRTGASLEDALTAVRVAYASARVA